MTYLLIKSYFGILISLGVSALFILFFGLRFIFSSKRKEKKQPPVLTLVKESVHFLPRSDKTAITSSDLQAIAGDDVVDTQLDLARAYLETGRHELAQKLLQSILTTGSAADRQEAQRLLSSHRQEEHA